ncbi:MAG: Uma2 family endonuclease [Mastigocoleus sp.]
MIQPLFNTISFEEFCQWLPSDKFYELHDGAIIEMNQPLGTHEKLVGYLIGEIVYQYKLNNLPYFIPNKALVKPCDRNSAFLPDILLINNDNLINEPLWEKYSTITTPDSAPLIIEVVNTNWRDDYYLKRGIYEEMRIKEYWICDYKPFGASKFTGSPKQATFIIHQLKEDGYEEFSYQNDQKIKSQLFPNLDLTVNQAIAIL